MWFAVDVCFTPFGCLHLLSCSFVLHIGAVESGTLAVGDTVSVEVDYERRTDIAPNHTMTHALNFALRKVMIVHTHAHSTSTHTHTRLLALSSLFSHLTLHSLTHSLSLPRTHYH